MSLIQHFKRQIDAALKKYNDRGDLIPPICYFIIESENGMTIMKVAGAEDSMQELAEEWEFVETETTFSYPVLRKKV